MNTSMTKHPFSFLVLGALGALFPLAGASSAQPITGLSLVAPQPAPGFQFIADTLTAVPGGTGTFNIFADAKAIEGGKVAFIAYDSGSGSGIYTFEHGVLDVLVDENTLVPGTALNFQTFFDVSIDGGVVAFTGGWPGPGGGCAFNGSEGIFTALFDGSALVSVADSLTTPYHCFHGIEFHQGTIAAGAGINPVDLIHNHSEAVVVDSGSGLNVLADPTTPKPGGGTFVGFDQEIVLDGNAYLLGEIIPNTIGAIAGLYADRDDGNGLSLVANQATPVPGGAGNFSNLAGADWDGGEAAFVGRDSSNIALLYAGSAPGNLRTVVTRSTQVPGTGFNFLGISNPIAYENGVIAFSGFWGGGGQGLFLHRNGAVEAVLKKGDLLDGHVVEQAFCRTRQLTAARMLIEVRFQSNPPLSHRALYLVTL